MSLLLPAASLWIGYDSYFHARFGQRAMLDIVWRYKVIDAAAVHWDEHFLIHVAHQFEVRGFFLRVGHLHPSPIVTIVITCNDQN